METKKRKKIIIISIVVLVLLGILLLIWRLSKEPGFFQPPVEEQPVFKAPSAEFEFQPIVEPPITNTEFTVINLAKSFAARFGSWSTDNQGYNLDELGPLATARMKNYLNNIPRESAEEFLGVTTKSLSAEIESLSSSRAEVLVGTQRIETDNDLRENIYYQDIRVIMINVDDTWLVDEARWQDPK